MARVQHQVGIAGDANTIYRALYEPRGLDGWWATATDGAPEIGGVLNLSFQNLAVLSLRLDTLEADEAVRYHCVSGPGVWQGSDLSFNLKPDEQQVWLRLQHENPSASQEDFLYFSTKWPCYLLSLRDFIETGSGRPYPHDVKIHVGD